MAKRRKQKKFEPTRVIVRYEGDEFQDATHCRNREPEGEIDENTLIVTVVYESDPIPYRPSLEAKKAK